MEQMMNRWQNQYKGMETEMGAEREVEHVGLAGG